MGFGSWCALLFEDIGPRLEGAVCYPLKPCGVGAGIPLSLVFCARLVARAIMLERTLDRIWMVDARSIDEVNVAAIVGVNVEAYSQNHWP